MKEDQYSFSALSCAYMRAYHARNNSSCLFEDFLAYPLIPEEIRDTLEHEMVWNFQMYNPAYALLYPDRASALARIMQIIPTMPVILSRARYAEDSLEQAVVNGVKQYVLLGAGMDTFAFRRPEMAEQLRVFEVDHPATQAFKLRRIVELGWSLPQQLYFVPVDFNRESLASALLGSPYNPQIPGFFNWLGVTYYLPRAAVFATLRTIAEVAPAGSAVVFDYFDTDAQNPEKADRRVRWTIESSRRSDEPILTCLNPSRLAADLAEAGLRLQKDLSPDDIQERYFQGRRDGFSANKHVHFALAVVI